MAMAMAMAIDPWIRCGLKEKTRKKVRPDISNTEGMVPWSCGKRNASPRAERWIWIAVMSWVEAAEGSRRHLRLRLRRTTRCLCNHEVGLVGEEVSRLTLV